MDAECRPVASLKTRSGKTRYILIALIVVVLIWLAIRLLGGL
jgi:hypothetical protein